MCVARTFQKSARQRTTSPRADTRRARRSAPLHRPCAQRHGLSQNAAVSRLLFQSTFCVLKHPQTNKQKMAKPLGASYNPRAHCVRRAVTASSCVGSPCDGHWPFFCVFKGCPGPHTLHRALHDGRPIFLFPGADGRLPIRPRCGRVVYR